MPPVLLPLDAAACGFKKGCEPRGGHAKLLGSGASPGSNCLGAVATAAAATTAADALLAAKFAGAGIETVLRSRISETKRPGLCGWEDGSDALAPNAISISPAKWQGRCGGADASASVAAGMVVAATATTAASDPSSGMGVDDRLGAVVDIEDVETRPAGRGGDAL